MKKIYPWKSFLLILFLFSGTANCAFSQNVGINTTGAAPHSSAGLDVDFNNKGVLIPRLNTSQMNAIASPSEGLQVYNSDCHTFTYYNGNSWITIAMPPVAGTHVPSATQIVWNWSAVGGATGYKYNTTNNYATATDNGTGTSYTQTGLTCNTANTLYIWAYNSCGSSPVTTLTQNTAICFTCGVTNISDSRDGKSYTTVLIGTQCWMGQNLNYGTRINGASEQTNNSVPEKFCQADVENNCDIYGGLYEWAEAMQYVNGTTNTTFWSSPPVGNVQGVCPAGWHLPTDGEWCTVENYVEPGTDASCNLAGWRGTTTGAKFKQTGTSTWNSPNTGATNSTGFTALGAGNRYPNIFNYLKDHAFFWSATESSTNSIEAWNHRLAYDESKMLRDAYSKINGLSVRCIKD